MFYISLVDMYSQVCQYRPWFTVDQPSCYYWCNSTGLVGAVFFVFFLAVAYEALKTLREWLLYLVLQKQKQRQRHCECNGAESSKLEAIELGEKGCECPEKKPSSAKVAFAHLKR